MENILNGREMIFKMPLVVFGDKISKTRYFSTLQLGMPWSHRLLYVSRLIPVSVVVSLWHPQVWYIVRLKVGKGNREEEGVISGHLTRLKPLQAAFRFWMVSFYQSDTDIYHSGTCPNYTMYCFNIIICEITQIWGSQISEEVFHA